MALLELTRYDGSGEPGERYLAAIIKRMTKRDKQGQLATEAARRLGCDAFVVLFRRDMGRVWVCNLTVRSAWRSFTIPDYRAWLQQLDETWLRREQRLKEARERREAS